MLSVNTIIIGRGGKRLSRKFMNRNVILNTRGLHSFFSYNLYYVKCNLLFFKVFGFLIRIIYVYSYRPPVIF